MIKLEEKYKWRNQYFDVFLDESGERLQVVNGNLPQLEKQPRNLGRTFQNISEIKTFKCRRPTSVFTSIKKVENRVEISSKEPNLSNGKSSPSQTIRLNLVRIDD